MIADEKMMSHFGQHLVSLGGIWYEGTKDRPGKRHRFFTSGILMSFMDGRWPFYVTAGHAIAEIDQMVAKHKCDNFVLVDYFGERAINPMPIPFPYADSHRHFIYEPNGRDFGLVHLNNHFARLLDRNGVVFQSEDQWINQPDFDEFDTFFMLGLPMNYVEHREGGHSRVTPCLIPVRRLKETPEQYANDAKGKLTDTDIAVSRSMFYCQISPDTELPLDESGEGSIVGMSGGPILGFSKKSGRYWLVALQSGWFKDTRVIQACPIKIAGHIISSAMSDVLKQMDATDPETSPV